MIKLPPQFVSGLDPRRKLKNSVRQYSPLANSSNKTLGVSLFINKINQLRLYHTVGTEQLSINSHLLDPNLVTGLIDAEGCFAVRKKL